MRAFRIYCGRGRVGGRSVSNTELRRFIKESVRPRFEAFTIQRIRGYWRKTSEPSLVIEIINPPEPAHHAVSEIAAEYKRRFGQEAVLVVGNEVQSAVL